MADQDRPQTAHTHMGKINTGSVSQMNEPPITRLSPHARHQAEDTAETLRKARAEGRMVVDVPLEQIDMTYLVRDRIASDEEDMQALINSIDARGQQTPIELVELDSDRYCLISGWRRLQALRTLGQDKARALITQPREASDAYVAMIEENEVRVGLSYFERARIVLKSVEAGVCDSHKKALQSLFSTASRPKRSKVKSFITVVDGLEDILRFPEEMGERLGLQLSKALTAGEGVLPDLWTALLDANPQTAEDEQAVLAAVLKGKPVCASAFTNIPPSRAT